MVFRGVVNHPIWAGVPGGQTRSVDVWTHEASANDPPADGGERTIPALVLMPGGGTNAAQEVRDAVEAFIREHLDR